MVVGDGARIARAVTNVVDNARKWSPAGGTVEIEVRDGIVRVRDHGPGIPEADVPLVFERFHRAATARSMPGSGLGLAIVRQTTEAHGGSATIENAPDGGVIAELSFGETLPIEEHE
jgi:two-component system sensor histidine kinase MprB